MGREVALRKRGISKVLSGASFVVCSNFLSSARHYSASPSGSTFLIVSPSQTAQVSISSCLRSCLLLRSGARLLANELLRRAVQVDGALPAGFAAPIVGPTTTQAFRQFMTCVSQLTRQAVFVCDDINGVGVSGTVWISPGVLPFVRRRLGCRQGAIPEALRQASVRRS